MLDYFIPIIITPPYFTSLKSVYLSATPLYPSRYLWLSTILFYQSTALYLSLSLSLSLSNICLPVCLPASLYPLDFYHLVFISDRVNIIHTTSSPPSTR